MEPVIRQLIVKRFRSIPAETILFDNPTFLVGRNGSGKSNIVDLFSFLADAMGSPLQAVFDRRGGIATVRNRTSGHGGYPPNLGIGVVLGSLGDDIKGGRYLFEVRALPNYGFEIVREWCQVDRRDGESVRFERTKKRGFAANVKGLHPSLDPASLALPVVGGDSRFAPVLRVLAGMRVNSIQPVKLREMQDPDSGTSLKPDGSNAASVLQDIERHSHGNMLRICETLATIVANTKSVRTKKHGNKISLEFTQEWADNRRLRFEAFNMSDGTLRAVGLLTAVYQQPPPSLLAIEEPEATIHPGALGAILDLLRHASKQMQVVVTTHSPEVLDGKWIRDEHLRIVDWREGATHVSRISDSSRRALQKHLMGAGELLRSNALEPGPLFQKSAQRDGTLFEESE